MHLAAHLRTLSVASLAILLTSCADEVGTHLDLTLVPDPGLQRVDQVLAEVARLELVVDAEGGLYAPGEEFDDGTLAVRDADSDPSDLELVVRLPLPAARLPRVRLLRGGLPDVPIDLRLVGYDSDGAPTADGSVRGLLLAPSTDDVEIPFNLRADHLPPRVSDVIATPSGGCFPPRVTLVFSRPVDPASVLAAGAIEFSPGGAPTSLSIDIGGRIASITPPLAVSSGGVIAFDLRVGTTVVDALGEPLDQFPAVNGLQEYAGRYDATCP